MTPEEKVVATLALVLFDLHPTYASTSGWRGGPGGQALTQGCSIIDPPPGMYWSQMDLPTHALREWLNEHRDFDLDAAKAEMVEELKGLLQ